MASTLHETHGRPSRPRSYRVAHIRLAVGVAVTIILTLLLKYGAFRSRNAQEIAAIRAAAARSPEARQLVGKWISIPVVDGRRAGYTFHPDGTGSFDWYDAAGGRVVSTAPINWWRSSETLTVEDATPSTGYVAGPQTYTVRVSPDGNSVVVVSPDATVPIVPHGSTVYVEVPMRRVK
jgi:hypothetical protein